MKKSLIFILLILFLISFVGAASPVLFFSDLTSGPKSGGHWGGAQEGMGVAVSIWGEGFGNIGYDGVNNYVTVNGAMITEYAEWGENLGPARDLDRITFWLNSNCADGLGEITVTVNGVTSNSLPFYVEPGVIYFISVTDGNNSYNGLYPTYQGGINGPWSAPMMGLPSNNPSVSAGTYVYMKGGTYSRSNTELDHDGYFIQGKLNDAGIEKRPFAFIGYPGESVIVDMDSGGGAAGFFDAFDGGNPDYRYSNNHGFDYIIISKLTVINGLEVIDGNGGHHNKIVGNYFRDNQDDVWSGVVMVNTIQHSMIYGNLFQSNGYDQYSHDIYIKTHGIIQDYVRPSAVAEYIYIGWNEIFDSRSRTNYGGVIEIQTESAASGETNHIYIHDNYIHDNQHESLLIATDGNNYSIWNNLFEGSNHDSSGEIGMQNGVGDIYIFNNVFYQTGGIPMVF